MEEIDSFTKVFVSNAQKHPEKKCFVWLDEKGREQNELTFGALAAHACALSKHMADRWGMRKGDLVLLVFFPGTDFIVSFLACLLGGFSAVPVYPPDPYNPKRGIAKLEAAIGVTKVRFVLSHSQFLRARRFIIGKSKFPKGLTWFDMNTAPSKGPIRPPVECSPEEIAFIQFTSGSTGNPKGVTVTYKNMVSNLTTIMRTKKSNPEDVGVCWVPFYHDLGLIGSILQVMFVGFTGILMSPMTFLKDPFVWLEAISKYRATMTAAPNFAYDLAVRKIPPAKRAQLDLSSCFRYLNGAEPVRYQTLVRFVEAFEPCGMKMSYFQPCFGMAENVLTITIHSDLSPPPVVRLCKDAQNIPGEPVEFAKPRTSSTAEGVVLVSNGPAAFNVKVEIVHPETLKKLGSDIVGEVWVSGPSRVALYYNQPEVSKECLNAEVSPSDGLLYMRTGDIGFIHNNELYICGRIKDMLIVRGRNVFPQDLEQTTELASSKVRPGCVAAFAIDEEIVIVAEVRNSPKQSLLRWGKGSGELDDAELIQICRAIQGAISQEHQVSVADVCLIKERSIPKTTSGKIQRKETTKKYQEGNLRVIASSKKISASEEIGLDISSSLKRTEYDDVSHEEDSEQTPLSKIRAMLGIDDVDENTDLIEAGLSSLQMVEVARIMENHTGAPVSTEIVARHRTINEISNAISSTTKSIQLDDLEPIASTHLSPCTLFVVQTLGCMLVLICIAAAIIPAYHFGKFVRFELDSPLSHFKVTESVTMFGLLVPLVIPIWMLSYSSLVLCLKWIIIGRYVQKRIPMDSLAFLRWWFVDRLVHMWEITAGGFLKDTPLLNLFYKLGGSKIAMSAKMKSFIREFDLVSIGTDCVVKAAVINRLFDAKERTIRFRRVSIGSHAILESSSVVMPGCEIGDGAVVEPLTTLQEGEKVEGFPIIPESKRAPEWAVDLMMKSLWMFAVLYGVFYLSIVNGFFWNAVGYPLSRYADLIFWGTSYIMTTGCATVLAIAMKWVLLGKRRPGKVEGVGIEFRAWAADFLFSIPSQTFLYILFDETQALMMVFRLLGAKIGRGVVITNTAWLVPSNADFLEVGENVMLTNITFRTETEGELYKSSIDENCEVGLRAVLGPNGKMEANTSLGALTKLEGETLKSGTRRFAGQDFPFQERGASSPPWSLLEDVAAVVAHAAFYVCLVVCLIPAYEFATLVLFKIDGFPREAAICLLSVSIGLALVCFSFLQKVMTVLTFGVHGKGLPGMCKYCTYQACTSYLQNYLTPVFHGSGLYVVHLRWLGANISLSSFVNTATIYEHPIISVKSGAIVDEYVYLIGHQFVSGDLEIGPSLVGRSSSLEPFSVTFSFTGIPDSTVLHPFQLGPRRNSSSSKKRSLSIEIPEDV